MSGSTMTCYVDQISRKDFCSNEMILTFRIHFKDYEMKITVTVKTAIGCGFTLFTLRKLVFNKRITGE